VVGQFPITASERSRWRGGRFACYAPPVMPQRDAMTGPIRFRSILATAVNSIDYKRKSIQIP
jgi:hypothetical protein